MTGDPEPGTGAGAGARAGAATDTGSGGAVIEWRFDVHWSGDEYTQPAVSRTGGPLFGSHFENVPRVGRWAAHGVCRDATPAFFPERGQKFDSAIALCRACPVVEQCRAYGLAHSSLKGIFGGLTEDERRRIRSGARLAGESVVGAEARRLFDLVVQLIRYPIRTWATVATSRDVGTLELLALDLRARRRPLPPGTWEFEVLRSESGAELRTRLTERELPRPGRSAPPDAQIIRLESRRPRRPAAV